MSVNQEVKGNLARLLATENLCVEHKQVSTASFNCETRILTLPMWQKASNIVYNMLVGHEVGHALYTPAEGLDELPCPKSFVNVTEDARVEKLMKRKFPGLSKDFYGGYQELHEDDFFSIADDDLETLPLIDRINLHYKIGAYAMMPFDASETPLRDAVGASETFDDAVAAALAIYEFMKQEKKQQNTDDRPAQTTQDGGSSTQDGGDTEQVTEQVTEQETEQESPTDEEGEKMAPEEYPDATTDLDQVKTQNAFDEQMQDLIDQHSRESRYVEFPTVDLDKVIINNKQLWDCAESWWAQYYATEEDNVFSEVDTQFVEFVNKTKKDVNYLVKEFECKKAASSYARSSIARTGVLDTRQLHKYKFSDDIFCKSVRTIDGKNHGLVFLLDWSGSMSREIYQTVCQVINLCQFCKKVGIPFDVYSFAVDGALAQVQGNAPGEFPVIADLQDGEFWIDKRFRLVNLLTSDGNQSEFQRQCKLMYRVAYYFQDRGYTYKFRPTPPHFLGLGGTPLNEALIVMRQLLPEWKTRKGAEKTHVVVLTDGEANQVGYCQGPTEYLNTKYCNAFGYNTIIRDRKTGCYTKIDNGHVDLTSKLLGILRKTYPECSFLGFRICETRDLTHYLYRLGIGDQDKYKKTWKKDRFAVIDKSSFTELYVLQSNSYSSDVSMEVDDDASKAQIRTAFRKSLKSKSVNRRLLSAFVGQIA